MSTTIPSYPCFHCDAAGCERCDGHGYHLDRHKLDSMEHAEAVAEALNERDGEPGKWMATDAGRSTWPRYGVIVAPKVGDKVSRYFNGDAYPAGEIATISPTRKKITTTTGVTFWRRKTSGTWKANGTWGMVPGHRNDRNPHF